MHPPHKLLFENASFFVVDKPAMVLSVPPRRPDERRILGRELQQQMGQQIFPVHRLDYEVSGLLLFAKTAESHRAANRLFELHEVQKTYRAQSTRAASDLSPNPATHEILRWEHLLLRGKKRSYVSPHGAQAVTEAHFCGEFHARREWELRPRTGKPHQLRVQMSLAGQPIDGDSLYGSSFPGWHGGISLRATSLEFPLDFAEKWGIPQRLSVPTESSPPGEIESRTKPLS